MTSFGTLALLVLCGAQGGPAEDERDRAAVERAFADAHDVAGLEIDRLAIAGEGPDSSLATVVGSTEARRYASLFQIGAELAGTLEHEARWRALIADVRDVYPGALVYAASWDELDRVPFWDAVDRLGVNAYFPISGRRDPTRVDLLVGWQPWLDRIEALSARTGRPWIFTEIGYRSIDGAAMDPSNFAMDRQLDLQEQADLYWAAMEVTRGRDGWAGLYWWNWLVDGSGGPLDDNYTPAGKPAEEELEAAWSGTP